jgi:hypothetical protein
MKLPPIVALLAALVGFAYAQTSPVAPTDRADLTADSLTRAGSLLRGAGRVRAKIGHLILQADEATLSSETGALELQGHATVTLPARSDHILFRYGSRGAVVTDEPVLITADHLSLSNAVLRGSGHILVKTSDTLLQTDEIEISLPIGDGHISGNIRLNGQPPDSSRRSLPEFPPDIIK